MDQSWEYINRSQTHDVEIGTEAALFPEKKYISGIFLAVSRRMSRGRRMKVRIGRGRKKLGK